MHHVPSSSPRSAVARTALHRVAAALRGLLPRRSRRILPVLVVGMAVGVLALAVPVVSTAMSRQPVSLDASSSGSAPRGSSPVVMGVDGEPAAGAAGTSSEPGRSSEAPSPGARSADPRSVDALSSTPDDTGAGVATDGTSPTTTTGNTTAAGTAPGTTTSSSSSSASSSSSSAASSSSSAGAPSSSPAPASAAPALVSGAGSAVLAAVDAARSDAGCGALTVDPSLAAAAGTNSLAMAAQGTLAVLDPAGSATLIDAGDTAGAAVATWLADDSAQLLDCDVTTAGAAAASGDGGPWWTLVLG